jgi:hypothetical protein
VDVEKLVTLPGNTHPLARPEFDRGAAPDSLPMERILLVLQRSPEQETALRKLLDEQQIRSSPDYHMWLTPEQFGEQFGPADADIQAVTDWLTSQGFRINRVAAGRTVIEFSGTAGAVRQAFHTEIHKFAVNGEEHWANASDPQIPAALRPVVAGFASLNNFPRQPMFRLVGTFSRSKTTGKVRPLYTTSLQGTTYYALGPTDFATIYNVLPLWQATPPIDGTGQIIAIVASSNINIQDVRDFRSRFGLPANDPQIIVDGPDPGLLGNAEETEADLDAEWTGSVAKNATIELVVSEDTESTFGGDLSAVYAIDNNLAPILSVSYGACESSLGVGGNAFYNSLWEQGAAQGITVVVASGDAGSAMCAQQDGFVLSSEGLTVSGTASTPFDVAVGGTDFNDVGNQPQYWSSTNNSATLASALSYIPEMTWNDSCARFGIPGDCANAESDGTDLGAGGGGASNCLSPTGTNPNITCNGGYAKPSWQSGVGVPSDGARDIPDVSLFAGNGLSGSFYEMCEDSSCNQTSSEWYFEGVGGTSVSTPTFAGILALVNQKMGEHQGNANYVLYPLAAKSGASCSSNAIMAPSASSSSCIFYDVVTGNNSVACAWLTPNCTAGISSSANIGILEVNPPTNALPAWSTNAGYDLATGLGSVNAANLVNKWTSVSFTPSTTTLANLSPTSVTHGQPVSFTINVAPSSGSGTPTGDVSLIAQTGGSPTNRTGIGSFALNNGSFSGSTNMLPGGTYGVTAHYAGNGTYGASDSAPPVQVTVNPESSQTRVALVTLDPMMGEVISSNATSVTYGATFNIVRVDVTNSSGQLCASSAYPCASGQVTLTDNGQPLDLGTYRLNSQGYAEDQLGYRLYGGSHDVAASYTGDSSYGTSTSPTDVFTITQASTLIGLMAPFTAVAGTSVPLRANLITTSFGVSPTGTVQFLNNSVVIGTVAVTAGPPPSLYPSLTYASASGTLSVPLPGGMDNVTAQYSGDINYASSTSASSQVEVADFSVSPNPTTINISAPGQSGTSTVTLTPLYGFGNNVSLSCTAPLSSGLSCTLSPSIAYITGSSSVTSTLTVTSTGKVSATWPPRQFRGPANLRLPPGWPWLLASLLVLAAAKKLAWGRRRLVGLLFATALLLVGTWLACGGGGGATSPPPSAPIVSLSANNLTFNQQNIGSTSPAQTVTLSNTGNATLSISGIGIYGQSAGDFAQSNNCLPNVGAGSSCTVNVTFSPTAVGARSANIEIADNASGNSQGINLSGTGVMPPTSPGSYVVQVQGTSGSDTHTVPVQVVVQ